MDKYKKRLNISKVLKSLIRRKGMTLEDLANILGITKQAISSYCRGKAMPSLPTLIDIAEFFGVSTDYLLTGEAPENKQIRELLNLSDEAIENLKEFCNDAYYEVELQPHINSLLSDRKFYLALQESIKESDYIADLFIKMNNMNNERFPNDFLMSLAEEYGAKLMNNYFDEFIYSQSIINDVINGQGSDLANEWFRRNQKRADFVLSITKNDPHKGKGSNS